CGIWYVIFLLSSNGFSSTSGPGAGNCLKVTDEKFCQRWPVSGLVPSARSEFVPIAIRGSVDTRGYRSSSDRKFLSRKSGVFTSFTHAAVAWGECLSSPLCVSSGGSLLEWQRAHCSPK